MNIQGSINQVIGQSTAAVGLVKHIKQQEELAQEQKAMRLDAVKREYADLQAKIPALDESEYNQQEELQQRKKYKELMEETGNRPTDLDINTGSYKEGIKNIS